MLFIVRENQTMRKFKENIYITFSELLESDLGIHPTISNPNDAHISLI